MGEEYKKLGETIYYASIYFYLSMFIGIVLLIAVVLLVIKRFSKRKKSKNSDKPTMSKPLIIANIVTYILLGIIILFILGFLLRPLVLWIF